MNPVQRGEDPEEAWDSWCSMIETIRCCMTEFDPEDEKMSKPFWRTLSQCHDHEEQLNVPGVHQRVRITTKDACIAGMGGVWFNPLGMVE